MKIIGVFGGSGCGKTTATKMLERKIDNSVVFALDAFMHKHWDEHKKEILDTLNVEESGDVWWYNYIMQNIENVKNAVNIIRPEIERDLEKFIMEKHEYDTIIIDWVFLPLISAFDTCDFTISISCDLETKIKRLSNRLDANNKLAKWPKDSLLSRIKNSSLNELGYKAKYNIQNTETLNDLSNNLNAILAKEGIDFKNDTDEPNDITYWDMDR